jgi:hypothetical protein
MENLKSKRYGNQNSAKLTPEQRETIKEKLNSYRPSENELEKSGRRWQTG